MQDLPHRDVEVGYQGYLGRLGLQVAFFAICLCNVFLPAEASSNPDELLEQNLQMCADGDDVT